MWFWFAIAAAACWALSNNLDSLLVLRYEKNPLVLMWFIGWIVLISMIGLLFFANVQTSWWWLIALGGVMTYIGDCYYYWILDRIDISVSSAMWAILSVQLSFVGFIWFDERWTSLQTVGVLFIILGVLLLAYWHHIQSMMHTIIFLVIGGTMYLPFWVIQKMALDAEVSIVHIVFWQLIANCILALLVPLLRSSSRKAVMSVCYRFDIRFWILALVNVALWFSALVFTYIAYSNGLLSLVSVVSNVQPFFIILFAWIFLQIAPSYAPRELLTGQSIGIKCISFSVVFIGLAFLVASF